MWSDLGFIESYLSSPEQTIMCKLSRDVFVSVSGCSSSHICSTLLCALDCSVSFIVPLNQLFFGRIILC
jgi:hypothetical protein